MNLDTHKKESPVFPFVIELRKAGYIGWVETTGDSYFNFLGSVPPVVNHGNSFLMGESQYLDKGVEMYAAFAQVYDAEIDDWRFFCRVISKNEYNLDSIRLEILYQISMRNANVPAELLLSYGGGCWSISPYGKQEYYRNVFIEDFSPLKEEDANRVEELENGYCAITTSPVSRDDKYIRVIFWRRIGGSDDTKEH